MVVWGVQDAFVDGARFPQSTYKCVRCQYTAGVDRLGLLAHL